MKTKILIILIVLVCLGVSGFFVYKNIITPKAEKVEVLYKGIWLPTLVFQDPNHLSSNIQKLKDIGVNTIFIQVSSPFPDSWFEKAKEVYPSELLEKVRELLPVEKEIIIDNIQTAHNNGLKVALTLSDIKPTPTLEEMDLEALNSKIVEYAELAEEYGVELFAPMNEPDKTFLGNTGEWRQEILPRIKEVYHGEIVWKGAGVGLPSEPLSEEHLRGLSGSPAGDFVGYDYIGFSSMLLPEGQTLEEYSQYVDNALKYVLALAERDGCKVMISEFGVLEGGPWSEEEIARAHEIVLEKAKGKVFGFFVLDFLEVELPGVPLIKEDTKTEEVLRRWFREIL